MSTIIPGQIVQLWPRLSDDAREKLVAIGESIAHELQTIIARAENDGLRRVVDGFREELNPSYDP